MNQIKVYALEETPRLNYTLKVLFGIILGARWEVITDLRDRGDTPLVNYSGRGVDDAFNVIPTKILFDDTIEPQRIEVSQWDQLPIFFRSDGNDDLPFDIFAASFYTITRYEEYGEFIPDEHGRFPAAASLAYNNNFLQVPIVAKWALAFAKLLKHRFPSLEFRPPEYSSLLTVDVDQPYAYLGKGVLRNVGGAVRDLLDEKRSISERFKVLVHRREDPYQVFEYMLDRAEKNEVDATFFFPVGGLSRYDKNPSWRNNRYRSFINSLIRDHGFGLHSSYYSLGNYDLMEKEVSRLEEMTNREVLSNRFHYIRFLIPDSYVSLERVGIVNDFSMGYPDDVGFRAGMAHPFPLFNLNGNQETKVMITPFQIMDVTLFKYMNLDADAALEVVSRVIAETREVGGLFVSLWHNTSLLDSEEDRPCRVVFEELLKMQKR